MRAPKIALSGSGTNSSFGAFPNGNDFVATTEDIMSVKGHIKEAAGFVKEEANEHGKTAKSQAKAQEGRNLRNEGRLEDGKAPKTTKPGTHHPEK